jgi:hypothetical protein
VSQLSLYLIAISGDSWGVRVVKCSTVEASADAPITLQTLSVIGFFSLPPASLAEANPDAYNLAMAGAPAGAGTCAHCGTGILHHVVCRVSDGRTVFIGAQCAERIGGEVSTCSRERLTSEHLTAREAARSVKAVEAQRLHAEHAAKCAAQAAANAPLIAALRSAHAGGFVQSIIADLERGINPLVDMSDRAKSITLEIIGKTAGRYGSKAYWAKVAQYEAMLFTVAV